MYVIYQTNHLLLIQRKQNHANSKKQNRSKIKQNHTSHCEIKSNHDGCSCLHVFFF
jgi:hypothetical protein